MSFSHIIGQDHVISLIQKTYESKRFSHAYLFVGQEGIGKRLTAKEFAKMLNCDSTNKNGACDNCKNCSLIEKEKHTEITMFQPEKMSISIDDIKKIQKSIQFRQTSSKHRVVVVDRAESMTREAANCFLKTLEEPPKNTIIILISTSLAPMLKTIVSRCQIVRFRTLTEKEKIEIIKQHKEEHDEKHLENILHLSGSVINKTLDFLDDPDDEEIEEFTMIEEAFRENQFSSEIQKTFERMAKNKQKWKALFNFLIAREAARCRKKNKPVSEYMEFLLSASRYFNRNVSPRVLWAWMMLQKETIDCRP